MQTRLGSFLEVMINVILGYFVALISQILVFPIYGINVSFQTNVWIGLWFMAIAIVRAYIIRRWFNQYIRRVASTFAGGN